MNVRVDNLVVNVDNLPILHSGSDGVIYKWNNKILKVTNYGFMTEGKLEDLKKLSNLANRLILPIDRVSEMRRKKTDLNRPCFGYTTKYLDEDEDGILYMYTSKYIDELSRLRKELHRLFTDNEIAITDSNPKNLLVSNDMLYLIDFDRNITKSSPYSERETILQIQRDNPYEYYNNKRLDNMIHRSLVIGLDKYLAENKYNKKEFEKILNDKYYGCDYNLEEEINELLKYPTMYDYAREKVKRLK